MIDLLAIVVFVYVGICAVMFFAQRSFVYFPQPRHVTDPASTMVLPVDGAELVITVRPRAGDKAIVYFGGNGEDVSLNLEVFAAAFPDHALYLMHYRGYGGSTGRPAEKAIHADAAALYAEVRKQHGDVAVIGRSLGSGVAARLASTHRISRLVLVTPYDSLVEVAASAYRLLPVELLLRERYESNECAPRITAPTLIIAAEFDQVIPRKSTEKLAERFSPGVAEMIVLSGVGHNDLERNGEYLEFLQAVLR